LGQKRTLSGWLTNRYLLIIRNEENFAEKKTLRFNYARLILLMTVGFLVTLALSIYLVTSVLNEWLDPRHAQMVANRQVIQLSMKIDSLETAVESRNMFIENIRNILGGGDIEAYANYSMESDSQMSVGEVEFSEALTEVDSQFRAEYEQSDLGLVTVSDRYEDEEIRELFLFKPVEGLITAEFEPKSDHFGVDIVAKENEPVKAVADGVVVFSSWTLDGGYVLGIQHRANLISVYKHNSELLKNVGSFVSSGDIIAIIGNTGELTSGPHLHLELWYKGNPVNPKDFIAF
jgi:murein DD-endopeptidase MepM/ murein hydrolase activator NlpD